MIGCAADAIDAACEGGAACLPELKSPLGAWCVYREGEHDCPAAPYSERSVYYESFDDQRSCSECTCGDSSGKCTGSFTFSYNNSGSNCPGDWSNGSASFSSCLVPIDNTKPSQISVSTPVPDGSCPPLGGELQGEIGLEGAVTVCCAP